MTPEEKRIYMQVWRANNPSKVLEYGRAWRENNRLKIREWDRTFYAENKESVKARQKIYCAKTLDRFAERSAKWALANHEKVILRAAKCRAKERGLSFDLELSDIVIPKVCPVLGIPIVRIQGKRMAGSASLDRINNALGYVKGNVWVISSKANLMKNNATDDELIAFANWVLSRQKQP